MQTPEGTPRTGGFGGLTSFVDPEVRDYNLALAVEVAEAGVDGDRDHRAGAVRARIAGTTEAGVEELLLWNPSARYTRAALE